ncbi:MAG TPA: glycosyl hydrolase family 18 protein [Tissierellaceae bacterium]|nr:glycosyl hydrolase family 18 protein [Tissierellaceae bacterium]
MKKVIIILLLCFIIVSIGGYIAFKVYLAPSEEVASYSDELYLIIEENSFRKEEAVIFIEDVLYFSLPIIKEYLDPNIFYDEEEHTLIITNKDKVNRYKIGDDIATVNNREFFLNNVVREINNNIYVPVDRLLKHYDISVDYFEETNAVVLDFNNILYLQGETLSQDSAIRRDRDRKSPIIKSNLSQDTILYIYAEYDGWYKVRTLDGILGYIEKKDIRINHTKDIFKSEIPKKDDNSDLEKRIINLTWDYTYGKVTNTDNIKELKGVNVISPTWFSINNEEGEVLDKGNIDYVKKYNDLGYEIWALIDNDFNPDLTHKLLSKSSMREKIIKDVLKIYKDYGFQGINIDFENVHLKTKDYLTQFVRELYPLFKEANMHVSMDITGISQSENWSMFYDRKRLQETVDYMILMAYDQHWANSPVAGAVAEYPWVEKSVLGVLKYIPNNKLILAVPFYTRVWKEENNKVSSRALTMEGVNKFIYEKNIQLKWDENLHQFYGEVKKEDIKYRIWLEDINSLEIKASLIHKYDLAGIASWRKGYETMEVWEKLDGAIN